LGESTDCRGINTAADMSIITVWTGEGQIYLEIDEVIGEGVSKTD